MKIEIIGAGVVGGAFGQALVAQEETIQWIDSNPERVQSLRNQGFQAAFPEEETDPCELDFLCVTILFKQQNRPIFSNHPCHPFSVTFDRVRKARGSARSIE